VVTTSLTAKFALRPFGIKTVCGLELATTVSVLSETYQNKESERSANAEAGTSELGKCEEVEAI
jgi:hypothetical protein